MKRHSGNHPPQRRYVTEGVSAGIPEVVQTVLWAAIDTIPAPRGYLQVFLLTREIKNGQMCQIIRQEQEKPPFHQTLVVRCKEAVENVKVFCIDEEEGNEEHTCIMLLGEEY